MRRIGLIAALAALMTMTGLTAVAQAAPPDKTLIFTTKANSYHPQLVNTKDLDKRLAKPGNFLPGTPYPGETNYVFGDSCKREAIPFSGVIVFHVEATCLDPATQLGDITVYATMLGDGFDRWAGLNVLLSAEGESTMKLVLGALGGTK